MLRPSPFFYFRLASNAFPDTGSVSQIEKKQQQQQKKIHNKSRNRRPWYPRMILKVNIHIFGLTKCTIYCKKCPCFCSCFSLYTLLLCSFFRLKELFQVKNGLTTSLLFFLEYAKNLGRSDNAKQRKRKRMA